MRVGAAWLARLVHIQQVEGSSPSPAPKLIANKGLLLSKADHCEFTIKLQVSLDLALMDDVNAFTRRISEHIEKYYDVIQPHLEAKAHEDLDTILATLVEATTMAMQTTAKAPNINGNDDGSA